MRSILRLFCLSSLLFSSLAFGQGSDDNRKNGPSVIVDIGRPHAWTLEEAHYLLERNRQRDLGLIEKDPSPLDPNDTVGVRADAIRTLLTGSVQYDQSVGTKNQANTAQYQRDLARYNQQKALLNNLVQQQGQMAEKLQIASTQLTALQNANPLNQTAISAQQTLVNQLTADNSELSSEITNLTSQTATEPTLNVSTVTPSEESSASALGDDPAFDAILKGFAPGYGNSKIGASIQLDNYINMQYEMVAKQLTLLRDQAGPRNRVLIVELPQSIYATSKLHVWPDFGVLWSNFILQSWWKISSTLSCQPVPIKASDQPPPYRCPQLVELKALQQNFDKLTLKPEKLAANDSNKTPNNINKENIVADVKNTQAQSQQALNSFLETNPRKAEQTDRIASAGNSPLDLLSPGTANEEGYMALVVNPLVQHWINGDNENLQLWANAWLFSETLQGRANKSTAPAYVLDLIPRQSSLNVAEVHTSTHQVGFAGVFGWLSGLGARGRFERQHQEYNQFTQQETYASGFGKGDYIFGWTFGPQPGTKQINEGLRTTYAVIVVPDTTTAVRLEATGCGYRRRVVPDNPFTDANLSLRKGSGGQRKLGSEDCNDIQTFYIEVPPTDDSVWTDSIRYASVPAGQRQTVTISGQYGREVGVLVSGTPLQVVPSITQPLLTPGSFAFSANAGDSGVQGVYQNVEGRQLVLSFTMPSTFVGTPDITLVSVGKEKTLKEEPIWRDPAAAPDGPSVKFQPNLTAAMFQQPPSLTHAIGSYPNGADGTGNITLIGQGFVNDKTAVLVVSGVSYTLANNPAAPEPNEYVRTNSGLISFSIRRDPLFPHWQFAYVLPKEQQTLTATLTQDDDGPASISGCTYTSANGTTHFVAKGSYFESTNTVTVLSGSTDLKPTATYTGKGEWDLDVADPKNPGTLQVKLTNANGTFTGVCSAPPAKTSDKPATTPTTKKKTAATQK